MTSKKKMVLIGALVLIMAISAIAGTAAWLNDSDSLENIFLVGAFTPPTKPDPSPDPDPEPVDPAKPTPNPNASVKGYIHEPYWDANDKDNTDSTWTNAQKDKHRLVPGKTTVKDPYIGIGPDSEAGYVYVYIKNKMPENTVYFELNPNWAPVTGKVTVATTTETDTKTYYSGGLFKYVNDAGDALLALDPSQTTGDTTKTNPTGTISANGDIWTKHPVFTTVKTAVGGEGNNVLEKLQDAESKVMVVHAFIYQQIDTSITDGSNDSGVATDATDNSKTVVEAAAIAWADKIENPTT